MAKKTSPTLTKAKAKSLAAQVVEDIDKTTLSQKVADKLNVTQKQALQYLKDEGLESHIHQQLVDSISGGAMAINALEQLNKAIERGERWAILAATSFNQALKPTQGGEGKSLHLHKHDHQENIFADLHNKALHRLGSADKDSSSESSS